MCEKDCANPSLSLTAMGSPPHVRERQKFQQKKLMERGITPACAGKTPRCQWQSSRFQDHPRMCGKDLQLRPAYCKQAGSPPHVRERPA